MADKVSAHLAEMPIRWNGLIVTFGFDLVSGRVEVTEIRVVCEDEGPVPVARRPPLARLASEALTELRTRWAPLVVLHKPSEAAVEAAEALLAIPGPRRGRPPIYGAEHWREVALVYSEGGVSAVADRFSLSHSTAWKWSRKALDLGGDLT